MVQTRHAAVPPLHDPQWETAGDSERFLGKGVPGRPESLQPTDGAPGSHRCTRTHGGDDAGGERNRHAGGGPRPLARGRQAVCAACSATTAQLPEGAPQHAASAHGATLQGRKGHLDGGVRRRTVHRRDFHGVALCLVCGAAGHRSTRRLRPAALRQCSHEQPRTPTGRISLGRTAGPSEGHLALRGTPHRPAGTRHLRHGIQRMGRPIRTGRQPALHSGVALLREQRPTRPLHHGGSPSGGLQRLRHRPGGTPGVAAATEKLRPAAPTAAAALWPAGEKSPDMGAAA